MATGTSTVAAAREADGSTRPTTALFELVTGYLLILIVIWTPRPWQARIYLIAAVFILWATWRSWPGMAAMGWRSANFRRSASIVVAAAAVSALTTVCAWRLGTLHAPLTLSLFVGRFVGYIIFACVQQFLLQDYFLWRLLRVGLSPRSAVLAAAVLFSMAHLPSPILTMLTFLWGAIAAAWFVRYRSLYSLALAHVILGITVSICVPGSTIHNMRVGLGYLTYHSPQVHHLSH